MTTEGIDPWMEELKRMPHNVPTPADHANTVREAISLSLGGTTDDALAALDALVAQARELEAITQFLDESGVPRENEHGSVLNTLERVQAVAAQAETAEDSDEEIARLEGALDTAHTDYDTMKDERDEEKRISEMRRVEGQRILAERDAAVQTAEQASHERDLILDNLQKEVIELIKTKELLSTEIQAAEQAHAALQRIADLPQPALQGGRRFFTEAQDIARAALAGNQT